MTGKPFFSSLLFAAVLTPGALAQPFNKGGNALPASAPALLREALSNANKVRFIGRRVVEFRRGNETIRNVELVTRDGRKQRVEYSEDGPFAGQVVVDDGRVRRHFFPAENIIREMPSRNDQLMGLAAIPLPRARRESLRFTTLNGERIAGFDTQLIRATDASGNVVMEIFIEPDRRVPLKRTVFGPLGTPVGSYEFTSIQFPGRVDSNLFRMNRRGVRVVTMYDEVSRIAQEADLLAVTLPRNSGATLTHARKMTVQGSEMMLQVYSLRDQRVTLIQSRRIINPDRLRDRRGNSAAPVVWERDGRYFALIGEVAAGELQHLARLLKAP